jgi:hypothetical protein
LFQVPFGVIFSVLRVGRVFETHRNCPINQVLLELMLPQAGAGPSRQTTGWLLAGFFLVYLLGTSALSYLKPLWYDELFTYHIARLPRLGDIWSALADGTDLNPPLYYLAARGSMALFGDNALALRLPALLGFGLMCLCLFALVARRISISCAWIALLFPLTTGAYRYAMEARPYGLLLGFCGLGLWCWQEATAGRRRQLALWGLALSMAAAVACHYFALVFFLPLGFGELVRTWSRRRLDPPVWLALLAALLPLSLFIPLLQKAAEYGATFWAKPHWPDLFVCYADLLRWGLLLLAAIGLTAIGYRLLAVSHKVGGTLRVPDSAHGVCALHWPAHEAMAILGLLALPALAMLLAQVGGGGFTARYGLASVIGFGIVTALAAEHVSAARPWFATMVILILACYIPCRDGLMAADLSARRATWQSLVADITALAEKETPLAVSNPLLFLELEYAAEPAVAGRLVYVSSCRHSQRHLGHDTCERALQALRHWVSLPIEDYASFVAAHPHFLVVGGTMWLRPTLAEDSARVRACGNVGGQAVFSVHMR